MKSVDPKDVLAEVVPGEKLSKTSASEKPAAQEKDNKNPYQAEYDKTYTVIQGFVSTTSKNTIKVEKGPLFSVLDQRLAQFDEAEVKADYIQGLAAAFETSLSDKRIIARIEKPLTAKPHQVMAPHRALNRSLHLDRAGHRLMHHVRASRGDDACRWLHGSSLDVRQRSSKKQPANR